MKKTLFSALVCGAAALAMTSCQKDTVNSDKVNAYIYNYITAANGQGEAKVSLCTYSFDFNWDQHVVSATTDIVDLGNSQKLAFAFPSLPFKSNGSTTVFWGSATNPVAASNGQQISNFEFELNPGINLPPVSLPDANLPEDPEGKKVTLGFALPAAFTWQGAVLMYTKLSYQIGNDYNVRTFWEDNVFTGETNTTVNKDASTGFQNTKPAYRIKIDMATKKATAVLYNAKFNEKMPEMNLILINLNVAFNNSGITVTGDNVIPRVLEGVSLTEVPTFPFTKFKFDIYGDMTMGKCEFTVTPDPRAVPNMPANTTFEGGFSGSMLNGANNSLGK